MSTLPEADLQFTIKVAKADFPGIKKKLAAIGGEIDDLGSVNTRFHASFRKKKLNGKRAMSVIEKKIQQKLEKIQGVTQPVIEGVLNQIKEQAIALTPLDTGALRGSAFVSTETTPKYIRGRVGYNITSGPVPEGVRTGVNYTVFVHEMNQAYRVGQWKFFQTAVEANINSIASKIREEFKEQARGG